MQFKDFGVEGNAPDMSLRVLSQVAPLGFIESNGQTVAGLEVQTLVWYSEDKLLDTLG